MLSSKMRPSMLKDLEVISQHLSKISSLKGSLNFPNAHFFIITKMIVIKDVCGIAKIIPIDLLVTVF